VPDQVSRTIVASIDHAVEAARAAAASRGYDVWASHARFADDAERLAVRFVHELHLNTQQVRIWGGESVVRLPQRPGRGGRNQQMALAAARVMAGHDNLLLLAAGTDGTDGPTEDAGALVDGETCSRIAIAEGDVEQSLRAADAGTALEASGDLVHTGPTGTNVGDLVIGLKLVL
jgi:glycerate 2-kinase